MGYEISKEREPKKYVAQKLKDAKLAIEEARRCMVDEGAGSFDNEDVHAVAMAQYGLGKAAERLARSK